MSPLTTSPVRDRSRKLGNIYSPVQETFMQVRRVTVRSRKCEVILPDEDVTQAAHSPTIVDVATRAGVSRATASRALGHYGRIAPATIKRVEQAAEALGYRPNELARAMRIGITKTIGLVIITDFTNAFFDRVTKAIVDEAKLHGYQVLITNTDEDSEIERQAVETLLEKQVDGLIVVPSLSKNYDHLGAAKLGGRPIMLIDRRLDNLPFTAIITDDFAGAQNAVRHAISLGHKRLGFLISAASVENVTAQRPAELVSTVFDRTEGFLRGAFDAGIKRSDQHWIFCEDEPKSSEAAVASLLDRPNPPTIIFTSNNDMALAVLKVAGNRRLTIGRDISLVTVDDSQWAAAIVPGITVIARPVEEIGRLAVQRLLSEIADPGQPTEIVVLPTTLIARDSVANLYLEGFRSS
ncbi:LacI family DNA-binding transcriptional regulator [Cryobacterium ruanii]|uniref:LacI family transcriptional regulator n=1 Tax=Cryobacterium ruanii TaxID=1259197 RepID=A0A4R9AKW5_9MICO|nr:LacI family DNA-binding transcriptional regulator [Cryobacterium ruanii]TFD64332.1 LacI family transcriptional regulator [Cryobacterium ruanii]